VGAPSVAVFWRLIRWVGRAGSTQSRSDRHGRLGYLPEKGEFALSAEATMASTEDNLRFWGTAYDWSGAGREWSTGWGGAESQWHGTILPRIKRHLPVHTILEIAPGFGRWTQFLARMCQRLILVDLTEKCISACRERFRDLTHIDYHVNDGRSLPFVADSSVDFVFSFDSLVHVEADVMESYLSETGRILTSEGAGFIHHSNAAEYSMLCAIVGFLHSFPRLRAIAGRTKLMPNIHGRAMSMSAAKFREYAAQAGIVCTAQERINWGGERTIDCFSTVQKSPTSRSRPFTEFRNPDFMREARYLAQLARLYGQGDVDAA
jgi:ubiquinone/menaquinone biosynthesis C-methylase UbiE